MLGGWHSHGHTQITVLSPDSGVQADWLTENGSKRRRQIEGSAICVTPGNQPHKIEFSESGGVILMLMAPDLIEGWFGDTATGSGFRLEERYGNPDPFVQHVAGLLKQAYVSGGPVTRLHAESSAVVLTEHLRTSTGAHRVEPAGHDIPLAPRRLKQVVEYVHGNLQADLSINALSRLARMSAFQFARQFKAAIGIPPHQYVLEKRVELALQLLRNSRLPIAEVAYACGFATQAHLTTVFRRITGSTPKACRTSMDCPAEIDKR